jgi:hypothetical protein
MENFSTPPRACLPWIANLATLAVVVAAIAWSGVQRPAETAPAAAARAPAAKQAAPVVDHGALPRDATQPGRWPDQTTARSVDGLQAVGYSPGLTP